MSQCVNVFVDQFRRLLIRRCDCQCCFARFFNKPGWSPDGQHARSDEIKQAYLTAHPEQAGTPGLPVKYLKAKAAGAAPVAAE